MWAATYLSKCLFRYYRIDEFFFRINSVSENRYFNNSKGLFDWLLTNNLSSLIMFSILQQHAILHHSNSNRYVRKSPMAVTPDQFQ